MSSTVAVRALDKNERGRRVVPAKSSSAPQGLASCGRGGPLGINDGLLSDPRPATPEMESRLEKPEGETLIFRPMASSRAKQRGTTLHRSRSRVSGSWDEAGQASGLVRTNHQFARVFPSSLCLAARLSCPATARFRLLSRLKPDVATRLEQTDKPPFHSNHTNPSSPEPCRPQSPPQSSRSQRSAQRPSQSYRP